VAEDDAVNQKIVQLILEKAGFRVDLAADGRQAVEACRRNRYDAILMDIRMPIMDGSEAARRIRRLESEKADNTFKPVAIIAMTGDASDRVTDAAHFPEMNAAVGKPLHRDQLLAVVTELMATQARPRPQDITAGNPCGTSEQSAAKAPPLDFERAVEEFMGQKDILLTLLKEFMGQAENRVDKIRRAAAGRGLEAIQAEAHTLRGAAANLRAGNLARAAADLQQAAAENETERILELTEKLDQELDQLRHYIQPLLAEDSTQC
jgi:CheY-like chemotaxis protein